MTTLAAFLFVIGMIVFVHELGHFLMARRFGVRVEVFSLGFGPSLVAIRRGDTDYRISAIPVGGYVKMAGEHPGGITAPDGYLSKPRWQRCLILGAGPAMNLLLAAVIIGGVAFVGVDAPLYERAPAIVGAVRPGSPAARAGILPGDEILSVSGQSTPTWESVEAAIGMRPHRNIRLVVQRAARRVDTTVRPTSDSVSGAGTIGVVRHIAPVVAFVTPGGAADRAGLREGDVITAIDGAPAMSSQDGERTPDSTAPRRVEVTSRRHGRDDQQITIVSDASDGNAGYSLVTPSTVRRAGVLQAARFGIAWTADTGAFVLQVVQGLLASDISVNQLMGPVGIAQLAGEAADISWSALFSILALLSVNVGIFNLLPIPVLDGGRILTLGIETVMRRDLTTAARRLVAQTGVGMLLILTVVVIYNDLGRLAWDR